MADNMIVMGIYEVKASQPQDWRPCPTYNIKLCRKSISPAASFQEYDGLNDTAAANN